MWEEILLGYACLVTAAKEPSRAAVGEEERLVEEKEEEERLEAEVVVSLAVGEVVYLAE